MSYTQTRCSTNPCHPAVHARWKRKRKYPNFAFLLRFHFSRIPRLYIPTLIVNKCLITAFPSQFLYRNFEDGRVSTCSSFLFHHLAYFFLLLHSLSLSFAYTLSLLLPFFSFHAFRCSRRIRNAFYTESNVKLSRTRSTRCLSLFFAYK